MRERDRDELDRLLASGRIAAPTRERWRERVLDRVGVRPWWQQRTVAILSPALAAAGVALYFGLASERAYLPRGDSPSMQGSVAIECAHDFGGTCSASDFLAVRVRSNAPAFLVAYAQMVGDDRRVWLFVGESALPVAPGPEEKTLDQVVHLRSIPPGSYQVHLLLSDKRLSAEEALLAPSSALMRVVPLEVAP